MSKKYDEMKTYLENEIAKLEGRVEHYRRRWMESASAASAMRAKCEAYEKLLPKLLGDRSKDTDEFFMLEGKLYKLKNYTLEHRPGCEDILSVDFVACPHQLPGKEEKV